MIWAVAGIETAGGEVIFETLEPEKARRFQLVIERGSLVRQAGKPPEPGLFFSCDECSVTVRAGAVAPGGYGVEVFSPVGERVELAYMLSQADWKLPLRPQQFYRFEGEYATCGSVEPEVMLWFKTGLPADNVKVARTGRSSKGTENELMVHLPPSGRQWQPFDVNVSVREGTNMIFSAFILGHTSESAFVCLRNLRIIEDYLE